jgi:hypothetical protein
MVRQRTISFAEKSAAVRELIPPTRRCEVEDAHDLVRPNAPLAAHLAPAGAVHAAKNASNINWIGV